MSSSRRLVCAFVLVLAVTVDADRSALKTVMLLNSNEAEGSKQISQQQKASQIASMVGTKVLNHLKSIRINKDIHAPAKIVAHLPVQNEAISKFATNALLSSSVLPAIKSAAPRDAKLAEDPNPQLADLQDSSDIKQHTSTIAAKLHAVHQKALALKHLADKADTDESENTVEAKNSAHALQILPMILPPIGIIFLGVITYSVVTIRKWQKIPSMPTQGRMDIEAVRASAERAGGKQYEHKEMKHASAAVR